MMTLEEEATQIISKFKWATKDHFECVIAGANSKHVQVEKIKAQIEVFEKVVSKIGHWEIFRKDVESLKEQLKKLEDELT